MVFKPGQSGNPRGAPPNGRRNLERAFVHDVLRAWEKRGAEAIERTIDEAPDVFVRVVASILPKQAQIQINPLEEVPDSDLAAALAAARAALDSGADARCGGREASGRKPPKKLPAVH